MVLARWRVVALLITLGRVPRPAIAVPGVSALIGAAIPACVAV